MTHEIIHRSQQQNSSRWLAPSVAAIVIASGWPLILGRSLITILAPVVAGLLSWFVFTAFTRLHITVTQQTVFVQFRYGWPKRHLDLDRVISCTPSHFSWIYGFGIRSMSGGWLWRPGFGDTVRLVVADGSDLAVGCDDPESLSRAVNALIATRTERPPHQPD